MRTLFVALFAVWMIPLAPAHASGQEVELGELMNETPDGLRFRARARVRVKLAMNGIDPERWWVGRTSRTFGRADAGYCLMVQVYGLRPGREGRWSIDPEARSNGARVSLSYVTAVQISSIYHGGYDDVRGLMVWEQGDPIDGEEWIDVPMEMARGGVEGGCEV